MQNIETLESLIGSTLGRLCAARETINAVERLVDLPDARPGMLWMVHCPAIGTGRSSDPVVALARMLRNPAKGPGAVISWHEVRAGAPIPLDGKFLDYRKLSPGDKPDVLTIRANFPE